MYQCHFKVGISNINLGFFNLKVRIFNFYLGIFLWYTNNDKFLNFRQMSLEKSSISRLWHNQNTQIARLCFDSILIVFSRLRHPLILHIRITLIWFNVLSIFDIWYCINVYCSILFIWKFLVQTDITTCISLIYCTVCLWYDAYC